MVDVHIGDEGQVVEWPENDYDDDKYTRYIVELHSAIGGFIGSGGSKDDLETEISNALENAGVE